jgi:thioesterase domain-containing protein
VVLSSPGTIAGIRETFVALLNGMTLHVADPVRLGINAVLKCVEDAQVTLGYMVPALLRQLLGAPGARNAFRHMRIIRTGGDIPLASDIALCRATLPASCHFLIAFSSTEVPTIFQWFVPRNWEPKEVRLPIGYVRRGMSFRLLDEDRPVPQGEVGELVVKSRYLALGYWQEGRLHPGPFLTDPEDPAVHILHTGDLVRLRPDGLAEMIGRKDRQIKIRGLRTDLGEIEVAMRTCRGVADAAVIVRRRGQEDATLVAFVVAGEGSDATLAELKVALARRLPSHMCPSRIHVIDAIPQLPGFKPDLAALERIDAAQEAQGKTAGEREKAVRRARRPPADAKALASVRAAVARAWTTALDRRSFRADRAWDEAGGDSLKALHLCCLIEESLGRRIPMEKFEPGMTPTRLVAMIAKGAGRPTDPGQCAPLVFFVPPADGDTPMLAQFRAACGEGVRFEVIQYPQWREMMATGAAFDSLVDATVTQVIAAADGKISLAGYSFGGFVAWEAAQRLVASGRAVEFLGLIDTQLAFTAAHQSSWRRARYLLRKATTERRAAFAAILERSFRTLARQAKLPLLKMVGGLINVLPAQLAFEMNYHLTYQLRVQSRRNWTPTPLQAPTYLFRTEEFSPQAAQATWGHLTNKLEVISVGGDHWSVLQPPLRERLCREFVAAVNTAQRAGRDLAPDGRTVRARSRSLSRSRRTRSRSGC